jgi:hypothetical protein
MKYYDPLPIKDKLLNKIYAYYQTIWRDKWREEIDVDWLNNYNPDDDELKYREKVNMLFLLSKFMYFGNTELRELLMSLYRDLYKYPIISAIRKANDDTTDLDFINAEFTKELKATKFLGVGNPSESGVHLLYYFRQECNLPKKNFINTSDIFSINIVEKTESGEQIQPYLKTELKNKNIKRYIFIDDFCGSGSQATRYLKKTVENIKFENPNVEIKYLILFSTEHGLKEVRKIKEFSDVESVFTLDESFKAFSSDSRYYNMPVDNMIDKQFSKATAKKYGDGLYEEHPLGFDDCQLLFGLFHNTPNNSLPIFWGEKDFWKPIFKRYDKVY